MIWIGLRTSNTVNQKASSGRFALRCARLCLSEQTSKITVLYSSPPSFEKWITLMRFSLQHLLKSSNYQTKESNMNNCKGMTVEPAMPLFTRFIFCPLNEFIYNQVNKLSSQTMDSITFNREGHNYNTRNAHTPHTTCMYRRTKQNGNQCF